MGNIRLNSASHITRFLASLINKLNNDEITESKAKALAYLTQIQLKALENAELEKKVKELESLLNNFLEKQENEEFI